MNNLKKHTKRELLLLLLGIPVLFLIGFALRLLPVLNRQPKFVGLGQYCRLLFADAVFWKSLLNTSLLWLVPILFAVAAAYGLSLFFLRAKKQGRILSLGAALLTGLAAYLMYLLLYFNILTISGPTALSRLPLTTVLIFFTAFGCCCGLFCLSGTQNRPWSLILRLTGLFLALNLTAPMPSLLSAEAIPTGGYAAETILPHLSDYAQVRPPVVHTLSQQCIYLGLAVVLLLLVWLADRGIEAAQGKPSRER